MSKSMIKWTLGLLAVGCMLAMAGPAAAEFTPMDSADFPLWGKYEMNIEPVDEDLDGNDVDDFTKLGTGTPTITFPQPGILRMDTSGGTHYYANKDLDQTWDLAVPDITFASGYTFEFRAKIITTATTYGFNFFAVPDDSVAGAHLDILQNNLVWGYKGTSLSTADNDDDFHVFRVAQKPGEDLFHVWRDGERLGEELTLTGDSTFAGDSKIWFGDVGSNWGTVMEIDYLRFTSGAYAPIPEPGTLVLLAGALLSLLVWRRR